jgi:OOP family OmpA-OmpF porin
MKFLKSKFPVILILAAVISLQACKAKKKIVQEPPPPAEAPAQPVQPPPPPPAPAPQPAAPAPAPDYNFSNVQFEFDSSILRTDAYPTLDKAATEMKKDLTVSFILKGYASSEGTAAHNLELSTDRANAVKLYLVNTGVSANSLNSKGYGISNPVGDNSTESGRVLNRRVEIKKQ